MRVYRYRPLYDNGLNDLLLNCSGCDGFENFSNQTGAAAKGEVQGAGSSQKMSSETGQALGTLVGTIAIALLTKPKDEQKQAIKLACGSKPVFGGYKMDIYRKCVQSLLGVGATASTADQAAINKLVNEQGDDKKSNAVWWIVGGVSFVVVAGLATFFIIRARKKAK